VASLPALRADGASVVIPAFDEEERIAATVVAAAQLPHVDLVVVVDDGSGDATAKRAREAGAEVVRADRNRGKGEAMTLGAATVAAHEQARGSTPRPLLFLDADLQATAAAAAPLLAPVLAGTADMTIATLPPDDRPAAGHGFVVRLARDAIAEATGQVMSRPLSGQRALTREAFDAALPLAAGWGVEVGLTIDLLRQGFVVVEVPVDVQHRVTGTDWRAQVHRGRQFLGVWRAVRRRGVGPVLPVPR
jgi:glycosyltransferase involved in cell wall biosynthesis